MKRYTVVMTWLNLPLVVDNQTLLHITTSCLVSHELVGQPGDVLMG